MRRRTFAFVLLFTIAWPTFANDEAQRLTAIFLTARAELPDPDFRDSVVLVFNNIGPTPVGVIVNRPTSIEVARLFPHLPGLASLADKVYFGGPVARTTLSFLFRSASPPPQHAARVLDGIYLSTNLELLQDLLLRDKPMEDLRIFIGYSGWSPEQLEAEVARGDWTLAPADAGAIFQDRPEHPWPGQQAPYPGRRT